MKIYLHEIKDQETELEFTQEDTWTREAVLRVDENHDSLIRKPKPRSIEAHFSLRKVDEVVVISGEIHTHVELVCSRCANLFQYPCHPRFSALFCKDPAMAGIAHLQREDSDSAGSARPVGQNKGFARHAHNSDEDEAVMSGQDLDITYLSADYIDLSDVISEQLQLQVPFQPLCKDICKGMCSHCGTDLNLGRCACSKIKATSPFSVLKDFKV